MRGADRLFRRAVQIHLKTALAVLFLNGAGWAQTGFTETGAVAQRAAEETVLADNLLGDGLRDALDPRMAKRL